MHKFGLAFVTAFHLIADFDPGLVGIVGLSLRVSLTAVLLSALIGLPLGAAVAAFRFPGRRAVTLFLNTAMGLPPVVVGLIVYLILSRSGPLGVLGLLFTPTAMIVAQTVLIVPIVAALTRQIVEDLLMEYGDLLRVMGTGPLTTLVTLLSEARWSLLTIVLAGFGRASAEVGAVMDGGGENQPGTPALTTAMPLGARQGGLRRWVGLGGNPSDLSRAMDPAPATGGG
ncbi:ABC transporter permease subunit, partial [Azospirillum brasilense]|nr:ABC transporter permease subunit [Azospirillum brasilense]